MNKKPVVVTARKLPPRLDVEGTLEAKLTALGMARFKKPEGADLAIPDDLTVLRLEELGKLYTRSIAFTAWMQGVSSVADTVYLAEEHRLKVSKARALLLAEGTREEKAARVMSDPTIQQLEEATLVAQMMRDQTKVIFEAYDRIRAGISREFTRRQMGEDPRGGNVPVRGVPSGYGNRR